MADDLKFVISVDDRDLIRAQKEQRKFQANVITIEQAYRSGAITASRYNGELAKQAGQLAKLGGTYNKANSEVRKYAYSIRNATNEQLALSAASVSGGKSVNRFGMYAQQVGYQVGDFFVQVQSGTSALVAFGQQGTQLAGLLPGLTGAVVGIGLAVGTMLARSFLQAQEAADATNGKFMSLEEAVKSITEETKKARQEIALFNSGFKTIAELTVDQEIDNITAKIEELGTALSEVRKRALLGFGAAGGMLSGADIESLVNVAVENRSKTLKEQKVILEEQLRVLILQRGAAESINIMESAREKFLSNEQAKRAENGRLMNEQIELTRKISEASKEHNFELDLQKQANRDALTSIEESHKQYTSLVDKVGEAGYYALEFAKVDLTKPIEKASLAAARLAGQMNITLGAAQSLIESSKKSSVGRGITLPSASDLYSMTYGYTEPPEDGKKSKRSELSGTTLDVIEAEANARMAALRLGDEELAMYERQLEIRNALGDYNDNYSDATVRAAAQRLELLKREEDQLEALKQKNKELSDFLVNSFADSFMSIVDGTKTVKDAFRDMARDIILHLYKVLVLQTMINAIGGNVGGPIGAAMKTFKFANGGAFSGGNVVPFASGGVVGSPTTFGMSGGRTGLMGEAGPEAIMPLQRGANGKLGVAVNGGESGTTVNQVINISTGVQQTVRNEIRSMMPQIAEASKAAVVDAKRRGGSYGGNFR
jgi:hypothetical protein